MTSLADQKADALRFITGFELKHGRGPSNDEVADAAFDGDEGLADYLIRALIIEGKVRRAPHSRRRKLQVLKPVAIPRAPDGEPLHLVRIGGRAE
ncbi:hypothetical protein FHS52_001089 [Erythromicrobium ramosum]|uniref:Uncharacterized protein n=1 Tax=Erythrobacter ramosus TaxID=35811 RepID=A0A6I4UFG2_9SPHN|nr:hypothetical protein [Erythrobacter ramosus]MBB3775146.1 hypothetical protein [Erythrobacter ramosus]MXP37226.1 hypothetical protein [Erythrobacter ramosus]